VVCGIHMPFTLYLDKHLSKHLSVYNQIPKTAGSAHHRQWSSHIPETNNSFVLTFTCFEQEKMYEDAMQEMSLVLEQRTKELDKAVATTEASCVELETAVKRVQELKVQLKEHEHAAKVCTCRLVWLFIVCV
jgi:chromosome condensin MukBEF ATPase and DNA-binding subunit MukB